MSFSMLSMVAWNTDGSYIEPIIVGGDLGIVVMEDQATAAEENWYIINKFCRAVFDVSQ